jgi:hypothetical protein
MIFDADPLEIPEVLSDLIPVVARIIEDFKMSLNFVENVYCVFSLSYTLPIYDSS